MSQHEEEARAALRARQGAGARYDAPTAPANELDWARRGTAYFARLLMNLSDGALAGPSKIAGVDRRWLVAAIGLQARMLAEAVAWVRSNSSHHLPFDLAVDRQEIALAATLPCQALRNLFAHSEVHLNVEWRDLADDDWSGWAEDRNGKRLAVSATPKIRAIRLWNCAIQLDAGGRSSDIPGSLRGLPVVSGDPLPLL
ncbi:maleylpyruvate isomerase N-terminal domain-containing protein [Rhizobium rhizogenes]|uniref:maleylpyruvate isomerase N-terminal domain-containing protein n=1 Tax=Rhizobium rhizogenes TaxID=359 RepID=UPI000690A70D|nr:maleylpyruvate isomerase N-terminal domain-containing protein [Rhizobium rhizogenes]